MLLISRLRLAILLSSLRISLMVILPLPIVAFMKTFFKNKFIRVSVLALVIISSFAFTIPGLVDWAMVARIREEGLQRSKVMEYESYIVDVLGARLTLSRDMQRAQVWALDEMKKMGLSQVNSEAYMDYGVTWKNPMDE